MRNIFLALCALLLWGAASQANAGIFKGFYYGAKDGHELALVASRALTQDSTGQKLMDAAKCKKDGSCASVQNYLDAFRHYDPDAGLTHVSQIPKFLDSLVVDCTVTGDFFMARVVMKGNGPGQTEVDKMHRLIKTEIKECVLKDPKTGRVVLALYCANPIGRPFVALPPPVKPGCAEIHVKTHDDHGSRLHVVYLGTYESKCPAYSIPSAPHVRKDYVSCEDCWSRAASESDGPLRIMSGIDITEDGTYTLYVPIECTQDAAVCAVWLCMDNAEHSTAEKGVPPSAYDPKTKIAKIGEKDWVILY